MSKVLPNELTGLLASIYKDRGKSYSNGGISERYDEVLVVGDGIEGPFKERPGLPVVQIVPGHRDGFRAIPVLGWEGAAIVRGQTVGPMFGGCFIHTSDSRFASVFGGPVPLHDRYETPAEYESLSR